MSFRVIIHAGAAKCGSSTIQRFLSHNAAALHEAGVSLVSSVDFTLSPNNREVPLGSSFALEDFAVSGAPVETARRNLLASIEQCASSGRRFAVISAENALGLSPQATPDRYPLFFKDIIDRFDVRLIAYARRHDEWLTAAWKQWGVKSNVGSFNDWVIRHCLDREPSFVARLETWQRALGADGKVYCNILSQNCLTERSLTRDFLEHAFGVLPVALADIPNANLSPPAAWLSLLSENRATLYSNPHDLDIEAYVETLIATDDGNERVMNDLLTAEGRARILWLFRHDAKRLIDGFLSDKATARKYFHLDLETGPSEAAEPRTVAEMTRYLSGAVSPQEIAEIERAFRGVMLGAMRRMDKHLSTLVALTARQEDGLLGQEVVNRDNHVHELEQEVINRDGRIHELGQEVVNRDNRIRELEQEVVNRGSRIHNLEQEVVNRDNRIHQLVSSVSWRSTIPLRAAVRSLRPSQVRFLRRVIKLCYWALTPQRIPSRLRIMRNRRSS